MELRVAWMCGDGLLPDTGGVLDQDAGLMTKLRVCTNIYRTVTRLRSAKGADIHKLTDSERRVIRVLREMGIL